MVKKEVLTEQKADANIKKAEKKKDKLLEYFTDKAYKDRRGKIATLLAPLLLDKDPDYSLTYDSFSEGLEPIYYWLLDFLKDPAPGGLGLTVHKGEENLEAAASSGYFGEVGARATQMQKNAMEYMGAINQVIKSLVNLLYDLKEFKIRLEAYKKYNSDDPHKKQEGEFALKGVWMDQVDIKKGKGSINMLAQDLKFITIRDAFFHTNSTQKIKDLDLNTRVKNLLIKKMSEFHDWVKYSEEEITKRYAIEKQYVKQQVGTLKLYASWVKPYLKAAQKLKMKEFNSAHVVNAFSNIEMELGLWGYKKIKPGAIHEKFEDLELKEEKEMFAVVTVDLHFRSVPQAMQGQGGRHYIHGGRVDMKIKHYAMSKAELDALQLRELNEDMDLIEEWVGGTLKHMQKELAEYLYRSEEDSPEVEKKPKKGEGWDNPFKGVGEGFNEMFGGIFRNPIKNNKEERVNFIYGKLQKETDKAAGKLATTLYTTYKKTHKMLAW